MHSNLKMNSDGKIEKLTTPEQFRDIGNEVFDLMMGAYILPQNAMSCNGEFYNSPLVEMIDNEYEKGKAGDNLLNRIWTSRKKLKEKLGIVFGDDDDDVLEIIDSYDDLLRLFVCKAFEYGYRVSENL